MSAAAGGDSLLQPRTTAWPRARRARPEHPVPWLFRAIMVVTFVYLLVPAAIVILAGLNAGDYLRFFALFTDDYFRRAQAQDPLTPEQVVEFFGGTPTALPAEAQESFRILEVRVLDDGRIGALFQGRNPEGVRTEFVVLVQQGDRYLFDDVMVISQESATPAP